MNSHCPYRTTLVAILISIAVSSPLPALDSEAKQMFYQAEYQNWLEYIERFQNHEPDSSFDIRFYDIDVEIHIDSPFIRGKVL